MQALFEKARNAADNIFARDGELEVDGGCPVTHIVDDTFDVQVWVWLYDEAAGIDPDEDLDEETQKAKYLKAAATGAVQTDADFRDDAKVSLGDDAGAYVSGWVRVTLGDYDKSEMQQKLLVAADTGYERGETEIAHNLPKGKRGDMLADFIAVELREVMEDAESASAAQAEALTAMDVAIRKMTEVRAALENVA